MVLSTALLKTPKILSLAQSNDEDSPQISLCWRQKLLLIKPVVSAGEAIAQMVPALQNSQWFESCLKLSSIKAVRLDVALGEDIIKHWASACAKTKKRVFLHLPTAAGLPNVNAPMAWWLKRVADWVAAMGIAIALSPLLLLITAIIYLDAPGPIFFRQWRVGQRGQLFQILKFRTMRLDAEQLHHELMAGQAGLHKLENDPRVTPPGRWLRKYSLDELPQLFNVLRGEMSLVGPRPLALYDAIRLSPASRKRLNALPGMTGFWQVQMRSTQRDLDVVSQVDLDYLKAWSPLADFKIMLLTFPKVFAGFGAF